MTNTLPASQPENTKPGSFQMRIQGGMLDALGINMYSTIAKSMVEFVANAYDGEANSVNITIPFDEIATARAVVRAHAKIEVDAGRAEPFTVLLAALPDNLQIVISDDGHGMSPADISTKFLPVNRKRRLDADGKEKILKSETGKRKVMGRKGLGKLAGFGVAEKVTIRTKRVEDNFWTTFVLDYAELSQSNNLGAVSIPASYETDTVGASGTTITLSRLRCDALKRGQDDLQHTLLQNFYGVRPEDFQMKVNDTPLKQPEVAYEFTYPEQRTNGFANDIIEVEDLGKLNFQYVVQFRKAGDSLRSDLRGARIYCHNRLAAGPSLFRLASGVHNFHGQDYLECVVQADELDELGVDFVSTDRSELKAESELVIKFIDRITEILKQSLAAHYKHKEGVVQQRIQEEQPRIVRMIDSLDKKSREPARKLLQSLGSQFGVGSREFNEIAPLFMNTVNTGQVLVRLIEVGATATEINDIADALYELGEVEKSQSLTVFRGRRQAITALQRLAQRGEDEWKKKQFEGELHDLLKENPWLIRQEFSRHVTSDERLETVCSELAKYLGIDHFAEDNPKDKNLRPDLVHLMSDVNASEIIVIELKSPSIPLIAENLEQLEGYMNDIEGWMTKKHGKPVSVKGFLIGTKEPEEGRTRGAKTLDYRITKAGPDTLWKVYDLRELIKQTEAAHADIINALEKDLGEEHVLVPNTASSTPTALAKESDLVLTEQTQNGTSNSLS